MNIKRRLKTDLMAIALILAIASFMLQIGYTIGKEQSRENEWLNNRRVVSVIVESGDTLWEYAAQYKPEWLDSREYIYEVRQLNGNMSSDLRVGDTVLLYAYGNSERYTIDGVYAKDGTIITDDGNEWTYFVGDVYMLGDTAPCTVTIDDNNTPHNVEDDIIISVSMTRG